MSERGKQREVLCDVAAGPCSRFQHLSIWILENTGKQKSLNIPTEVGQDCNPGQVSAKEHVGITEVELLCVNFSPCCSLKKITCVTSKCCT